MGVREHKVEKYLHDEVTKRGGTTYKWVGIKSVPDRIVLPGKGDIHFVEVKTVDGKTSPGQNRMFRRFFKFGVRVHVLYGQNQVDEFVSWLYGE